MKIPCLRWSSWEADLDMDTGMQEVYWEVLLGTAVLEWGKLDWEQGEAGLGCDCSWGLSPNYCNLWNWDGPVDVSWMESRGYSPHQQPLHWGCPQEGAENWASAFMRAFTLKGRTKQWVPTSTVYPSNREHKVSCVDSCLTHNIAQRKWRKIWTLLKRETLKIFQFCFIYNRVSENY